MWAAGDVIGWRGTEVLFHLTSAIFCAPYSFKRDFHSSTMDDEERPRKLPKLDRDESQEDLEPAMTGAVGGADTRAAEDATPESSPPKDEDVDTASAGEQQVDGDKEAEAPKITKSQLKKQRRRERWEAAKERRKEKRKERTVEKRQRRRAELEEAKQQGTADELLQARRAEKQKYQNSILMPLTIVVDCSFDDLMIEKERTSLGSQITRSYSDNTKAPFRSHLVVSSFDKLLKERFDTVLGKAHKNWKGIRFLQEDYLQAADMAKEWMQEPEKRGQMAGIFTDKADAKPEDGEIVYLSSESPDTLTELKPYSTYIVGGLVDKNRYKGICYNRATEKGVKTAKLPIGDYIQMASRQVLTTNHVVEIMLRWLELGDWGKAFMQVIPQRKGGTLLEQEAESESQEQLGEEVEEDANDENQIA